MTNTLLDCKPLIHTQGRDEHEEDIAIPVRVSIAYRYSVTAAAAAAFTAVSADWVCGVKLASRRVTAGAPQISHSIRPLL